ncbi:MAG: Asp-tRNA(Asn)/Glu-tRNA(Gln) amidotransferase subunit GatB, partial [Eggerthellaceae bacterium]|nr:Asp-tRNA(Asn)/Glu-tRNA(Gln) amidotransferase subunit GatB [Eggerthellaceae bacterium]
MRYETVIGLEVHVELATDSKIFCSCANRSLDEQNTHVCPACCGMPGMLPVTNKHAVDLGMTAGMMLNCHINRTTTFDKKSYYYPDLPASYQTTQWFSPVAVNGTVRIETENGPKDIRIKQIHMEEDAGKLVHDALTNTTLVDFNRTSVPLIEIVSQPDLSSADEVVAYLERLRSLLRFAKVSECRMELGTMRCDVNLSVRPEGSDVLGVRTEMKNMNSVSAIRRAIAYEVERHIDAIENGTEELVQETRRWDDERGMSFAMRNKETAGDYRYFPDPNVMPIVIDDEWFDRIKGSLPPFPEVKKQRLMEQGLTEYDADLLTQSRVLCDCYDAAYAVSGLAKECANWIATNCLAVLKKNGQTMDDLALSGTRLGELVK